MMDIKQVDKIILQHFKALGWKTEKNVHDLKDLDVSEAAKLMIKCINMIHPQCEIESTLPHNMAQRFRCAANIASIIKNLGYHGDLGYQSILYPNEVDLRKLFMFLIEKIPKDSPTILKGPQDENTLLQMAAKKKIQESLSVPWLPPHCISVAKRYRDNEMQSSLDRTEKSHCKLLGTDQLIADLHAQYLTHEDLDQPADVPFQKLWRNIEITTDSISSNVLPNLIPNHRSCIPTLMHEPKTVPWAESLESVPFSGNEVEKFKEREGQEKLNEISSHLNDLETKLRKTQQDIENSDILLLKLTDELNQKNMQLESEEKRLNSLKKTSSLSSDMELNLEKLETALKASKERDKKLLNQWMDYKAPFEQELNTLRCQYSDKKDPRKEIIADISDLKQQLKSLAEDSSKKENLHSQLIQQKENLPPGVNRSVYTKQILDISSKVRLQKKEVDNVLSDTKVIQKEINNLTGKLQRTFAAVEDASFKAASSNERARPIYRAVIAIHEEFDQVVDVIRETGILQREIADIKEQVNTEKSKKIEENLNNLQEDYNRVKTENATLKKQILASNS